MIHRSALHLSLLHFTQCTATNVTFSELHIVAIPTDNALHTCPWQCNAMQCNTVSIMSQSAVGQIADRPARRVDNALPHLVPHLSEV